MSVYVQLAIHMQFALEKTRRDDDEMSELKRSFLLTE